MANPIPCDMGCGLVAAFLVGNLETGDQTAFCVADFARAGLAAARATLPQGEVLDFLGIASASEAETEAAVNAARKTAKGRKNAKPQPSTDPAPPPVVEETATTVTDGGAEGV